MRADGQLETKAPQSGFAQSYVDGIGANPPELIVFSAPQPEASSPAPARAVPRPEILAALESTAHRYGGHPALRRAGLSVTEWQTLFQANIEIESAYRPNARSSAGAIGLGQLAQGNFLVEAGLAPRLLRLPAYVQQSETRR